MSKLSQRALEAVESLLPRVRRRRNAYALVDERIDAQRANDPAVPTGAFRCERCERVQSRFAVGGLAEATDDDRPDVLATDESSVSGGTRSTEDAKTEVWCLDCIEHRAEVVARTDRTPGLGAARRD